MLKLIGFKKINIAVFISGTGTNLKNLIKHSLKKRSKFSIKLVISDKSKAKGLEYAKKFKIKRKIINYYNIRNAEKKIFFELKKNNINLICLAGYMKILSKNIINIFNKKIINIHPSLLPKFKGLDTFRKVLENGEKKTGCTVHYVNKKLDDGNIIVKKCFFLDSYENEKTLKQKTQNLEYKAYPEAIIKIFQYC